MARLLITTLSLLLVYSTQAQNTGIGITTPRAKLHVFAGASGNISPYSPLVVESNSNTFINLLSPDANETAILFGRASDAAHGAINYNNPSTPNGLQFRTNGNVVKMVIRNDGNIGIGNINPNAPLAFPPSLGKKITLYPGGTGDVGFAVQGNLFQMYSDNPNADIAFGYDQAGSFTERFRMKANGAFVVNGNAGSPGQMLQSNGAGTVPSWSSPTNLLYSNTIVLSNNTQFLVNNSNPLDLPGMSYSFTTTTNARVIVNFSFNLFTSSCFACGTSFLGISVKLDGAFAKEFAGTFPNAATNRITGVAMLEVGPGSHTISFTAGRTGPDVYLFESFYDSEAVLQIIPQ